MSPTELADALASIPFDPIVTVSAAHAAAILDASHALRRLERVEGAGQRVVDARTLGTVYGNLLALHTDSCVVARTLDGQACNCGLDDLRAALRAE